MTITSDRARAILNAVADVFPRTKHLICQWHIARDVRARAIRYFRREARLPEQASQLPDLEEIDEIHQSVDAFCTAWQRAAYAKTRDDFTRHTLALEQEYIDHPILINYLKREWLPHSVMFVPCFTNKNRHFGNGSSNRVEGIHSAIKRQFQSRNLDLQQLIQGLRNYAMITTTELVHKLDQNRQRRDLYLAQQPCFTGLQGVISNYALRYSLEHSYTTTQSGLACSGVFTRVYGMPCGHKVQELRATGRVIPHDAFHAQWRLDQLTRMSVVGEFSLLRNPKPVIVNKRFQGNGRSLSAVELLEKGLSQDRQLVNKQQR